MKSVCPSQEDIIFDHFVSAIFVTIKEQVFLYVNSLILFNNIDALVIASTDDFWLNKLLLCWQPNVLSFYINWIRIWKDKESDAWYISLETSRNQHKSQNSKKACLGVAWVDGFKHRPCQSLNLWAVAVYIVAGVCRHVIGYKKHCQIWRIHPIFLSAVIKYGTLSGFSD